MNVDSSQNTPVKAPVSDFDLDNFDFKPITSGLGFHQQTKTEVKPAFVETAIPKPVVAPKKVAAAPATLYQNDLSLFYDHQTTQAPKPVMEEEKPEKQITYKTAGRLQRSFAYVLDLAVVGSLLTLTLTAMARAMDMDLIEAWMAFPHDITPLALTLFCGFYLIYFSVMEKASGSTIGKNLMDLKVVSQVEESLGFSTLLLRSFISLLNFVSLGLFFWYDLQSKISQTRVVRSK